MEPERRRFRRCSVPGSEIKVFTPETQKVHSTKNISKVGLAFEYASVDGEIPELGQIDILALDYEDRIYLSGVACKTIYDTAMLMEGRSFRGGHVRLRGLEFIDLSTNQERILNNILDQCFERMI